MKQTTQKKHEQSTKRFLLYLSPELMQQLREDAAKNFRTVSGQVSFILQEYFDRERATTENQEGHQTSPRK